jgi:hypothetical protein
MSASIQSPTPAISVVTHLNGAERQAAFITWVTGMFGRAHTEGITLEKLTDFELEWVRRM